MPTATPRPLHLYVNIPFCAQRCAFCSQRVYIMDTQRQLSYCEAVKREMTAAAPDFEGSVVRSILIGGGSPTVLPQEAFLALVRHMKACFCVAPDAEITVEASPNRVDASWMVAFQHAGVSRLSLGIVTGRQRECERLGACWNIPSAETALILPQVFGLKRYEATLLYGIPGQTAEQFAVSLRFAVRYHTPEITLQRMTRPTGSAWAALAPSMPAGPDEAQIHAMKAYACEHLEGKGYTEYRPEHWAKPGCASRHLLARESGEDYLSFGPGTNSMTHGVAYHTTDHLAAYIAAPDDPAAIYTAARRVRMES